MRTLLDRLDLLAKRDLAQLMKLCGVDAEDMKEMIAEIRTLNPKPGSIFDHAMVQPVIPTSSCVRSRAATGSSS